LARHRVAATDELPIDTMKNVKVGNLELCLAHADDGEFYAINDVCTHEEFNLSDGELWGLEVECPQHASRFDLRDGHVTGLPAVVATQSYPVTVEGGDVYVDV
jgi:3-phenylpropionate/trans-cinnamate dioxygenase ferredoxin subunit